MKKKLLISSFGSEKDGMGHIKRSIWLGKMAQESLNLDVFFLINPHPSIETLLNRENVFFSTVSNRNAERIAIERYSPDLLIVDKRDTHDETYRNLPCRTLSFDNYGSDSNLFDYTLCPLEHPNKKNANYFGPRYMIFPKSFWQQKKIVSPPSVKKILVTFGGADPADISFIISEVFARIKSPYQVDIILGPLYQGKLSDAKNLPSHIRLLDAQENLYPLLASYDMVVTSFGLTAYESIFLETPVFIINPSDYHQKLTELAGFVNGGTAEFSKVESFREMLFAFMEKPHLPYVEKPSKNNLELKTLMEKILETPKANCPICGGYDYKILKRNGDENLYFCLKDYSYFRNPGYRATLDYQSNYFVEDYKKQYGKTYEEDRPNIDKLNTPRLESILELLTEKDRKYNLLEVGCALGFFMDMAQKTERFDCDGIEISPYASAYAVEKLGLKVKRSDFLEMNFDYPYYDVLAMWYYIEHNPELEKILCLFKKALKIGGILAIATPNADGISSRKNRVQYASRVPEDHYVEFSPNGLIQLMEKNGFQLKKLRITGVHPDRWIKQPFQFIKSLLAKIMRKKHLGDTFEAYFERIK